MEENKIYLGDCLDNMKGMDDNSVSHSFTSPPYNRKRNDKYKNYDDNVEDYFEWMCKVITELMRVSKGYVFFNIQKNYYNKEDVFRIIGKFNKEIQEIIIWEKENPLPASGLSITNAHEYFIVFGSEPLKSNQTYTKNIFSSPVNSDMPPDHKAVMSLKTAMWFIERFTQENDCIFDCFGGYGTTAIACDTLKRRFICIEKDPDYHKASIKRLEQHQAQMTMF